MVIFTPETIIYSIVMFVLLIMIYKNYETDVTSRNYLIMVYLYISLTLFSIIMGGKIIKELNIIKPEKMFLFVIAYMIISVFAISLIMSNDNRLSHLGLFFFILMQSALISLPLQYSTNINEALIITSVIFVILTAIVMYSSEETVLKMAKWIPNLLLVLSLVIVSELLFLLFASTETIQKYGKYFNWFIVLLFSFFVLSNTSVQLLKSSFMSPNTGIKHEDLNYPKESVNLSLDFMNILYRLINVN